MSRTVRCSICHELTDAERVPELCVGTWTVCEDCWHSMQDYLTARGFTLLQLPPAVPADAEMRALVETLAEEVYVAVMDGYYHETKPAGCDAIRPVLAAALTRLRDATRLAEAEWWAHELDWLCRGWSNGSTCVYCGCPEAAVHTTECTTSKFWARIAALRSPAETPKETK